MGGPGHESLICLWNIKKQEIRKRSFSLKVICICVFDNKLLLNSPAMAMVAWFVGATIISMVCLLCVVKQQIINSAV